ncbi:hypothetical protein [Blastopirellula marina]|uniref:Uncharacterized protein n=1 Tax=Blastopirellula marina TaxID=124 RepID=A0A2S8F421_9BACT|nr:hypothetical protein [Blastopirellula marina]PQO26867.1 hypothetical protein C5Y98_29285 [Blastopirellula marina]PQO41555.1 hypothetical protein C5Y93_31080 [Blastopirellula marina]PTL41074.1 hypothetical protein C5Y97_29300 [Blastopirellula marina]
MNSAAENPYASPAEVDDVVADTQGRDGRRPLAWIGATMLYQAIAGAIVFSLIGFVLFCFATPPGGSFGEFYLDAAGRLTSGGARDLATVFLSLAIFGFVMGGVCGFLLGSAAFSMRGRSDNRWAIALIGYVAALVLLWGPTLFFAAIASGLTVAWRVTAAIVFGLCTLVVAQRANAYVRRKLLPQVTGE